MIQQLLLIPAVDEGSLEAALDYLENIFSLHVELMDDPAILICEYSIR